jgi:hypothetical protein
VERLNSRIIQAIHSFSSKEQKKWDVYLSAIQFALGTTPRTRTGISPFFAVFCREPTLPYDIMIGINANRALDLHKDIEKRLDMLDETRRIVHEAYDVQAIAMLKRNEEVKKMIIVTVGDHVMVFLELREN